jgi:long-chain acyl-CoA synthetase
MATNFVFAQLTAPFLDLGGTVEVVDFGSADQTLKAIERGATFLSLIPWFGYQLIEAGRRRPPSLNRLRACAMGGDRIPLGFFDEFREVFGILPREHLGMAETNVYVVNPPEEDRIKVGSVGLPMPDAEVEVRGPQGKRLPIGAEGEIWVKALTLMEGYWEDPDLTEAVLVDGWFGTGDLGHLDEDGYLWFSGRARHLIVCDGDNIHPREIEHEIARHPRVEQACVVGVPDRRRGETVGVALTPEGPDFDLGLEELASYLEHRLTEVKIPKSLVVLKALPETVNGKVDRRAVLSLLQGTAKG